MFVKTVGYSTPVEGTVPPTLPYIINNKDISVLYCTVPCGSNDCTEEREPTVNLK